MRRLALVVVLLAPVCAHAQGASSTPLPGYACMMLADPDSGSPVLAAPSATAQRIGIASAIVIVVSPSQTMNGFAKVLHLDGRPGWVDASRLRIYRAAADPSATCTPVRRADGRIGFR